MQTPNCLLMTTNPAGYAASAVVWREIATRMDERLDCVMIQPKTIVEVGCRTGYGTALLAKRYPDAEIHALDVSAEMLDYARKNTHSQVTWLHSKLETLPFPDH